MKDTGVIRRIDNLWRIVIPMELRKTYELIEGTPMEIFVDANKIVLQKYTSTRKCAICGALAGDTRVVSIKGVTLCGHCIK